MPTSGIEKLGGEMTDTVDRTESTGSGGSGLDSYFKLSQRGSSVGTEIRAGVTTFLVMAYIIFVNPAILVGRGLRCAGRGRRHRPGRRPALHPDGGGGQLSHCDGSRSRHQRCGGLRPRPGSRADAGRSDGCDRPRRSDRARSGGRGSARGDHERGAPGLEKGDRGRHRALHHVHRVRRRRADPSAGR